ncbi:MAG: hypothetical protein ACJ8AH_27300, partial [Stellaceae bacterium]
PVGIKIDTANPSGPFIELTHQTRDRCEGDRVVRDRIRLIGPCRPMPGGAGWFQCPRTYRKTTKLYLPNGGWHFWSRQAYRLGYACQRQGRLDRLQRRAAKLNSQLGGGGWGAWDAPPRKPKWMRWRTYERKYEVWERVVDQANTEFTMLAARLLKRL